MPLAYIALGANLDDPLGQLRAALDTLAALPGSRLLRASSFYRTAPVGAPGQPDYLNAVAALETSLAEGLRFEKHAFSALFDTEDQKEGMAAFREKRAPEFTNR